MAHRLASEVETELDEIWYFIATESGSVDIADRFMNSITDRFFRIAAYPYAGRVRTICAPVCVAFRLASTLLSTGLSRQMCSFSTLHMDVGIWNGCSASR
jgi:hypothetical protein